MVEVTYEVDQNKAELRQQYVTAVTTLESIRDAESLTQAQAISAVQYMARVLIWVLRLAKNYFI